MSQTTSPGPSATRRAGRGSRSMRILLNASAFPVPEAEEDGVLRPAEEGDRRREAPRIEMRNPVRHIAGPVYGQRIGFWEQRRGVAVVADAEEYDVGPFVELVFQDRFVDGRSYMRVFERRVWADEPRWDPVDQLDSRRPGIRIRIVRRDPPLIGKPAGDVLPRHVPIPEFPVGRDRRRPSRESEGCGVVVQEIRQQVGGAGGQFVRGVEPVSYTHLRA